MTYTQVRSSVTGDVDLDLIIRDSDGAFIPNHPDNVDWQDYQAWLDQGNEPKAATTLPDRMR